MSLQAHPHHRMERRADQLISDRVFQPTEVAANKAQAESVTCDRCGKKIHPSNWMKHQNSDHGDDPKPLHTAQKDERLPLAAIRTDGGTQPRSLIDSVIVEEYAEAMNDGAKFPSLIVFFDGQDYWLADGFHRLNAALKLNWLDLPADVHQGTQRDAILFSTGVNATHGLRRTNADKRRAVERLLRDEEWSKWSDREIARRCAVSDRFVNGIRKMASANGSQIDTRLASRNGTTYEVNTGNIGKGLPPVMRPPGTETAKAYEQAAQVLPPVTRPPATTYTKLEDDFVDEVPSVEVDADDDSDWLDDALAGKGAESVSQAQVDLQQVTDSEARQRLSIIVAQHEADEADRAQRKANWAEHERLRLLAAQTPPPEGQYRTIVIDPPWPMKKIERGVRPNQGEYLDYPTMQLADIYHLGIEKLAAEDGCHLYLWTTHKFLPEALKITGYWGFRYNCLLTWEKNTGMTPYHFRFNTELVIFATRGSMAVQRKGLPLCFRGESSGHSAKPDTFYDMAAQASPEPRLEMFARREREGFTVWGNEVGHAAAAG